MRVWEWIYVAFQWTEMSPCLHLLTAGFEAPPDLCDPELRNKRLQKLNKWMNVTCSKLEWLLLRSAVHIYYWFLDIGTILDKKKSILYHIEVYLTSLVMKNSCPCFSAAGPWACFSPKRSALDVFGFIFSTSPAVLRAAMSRYVQHKPKNSDRVTGKNKEGHCIQPVSKHCWLLSVQEGGNKQRISR